MSSSSSNSSSSPPPETAGSPEATAAAVRAVPGYKPSGKIGPLGVPLLLASLLAVPPLAAYLYVSTAHFGGLAFSSVWALVVTAALLGAVVGAGLFPAIHLGKVRNTGAAAAGLLAGTLAFPLSMGMEAWDHRAEVRAAAAAAASAPAAAAPLPPLQNAGAYWAARAEGGQEVTGRRGRGATVSGEMFWGLTALQWLLAAVTAAAATLLAAGRRYSEQADRWFVSKTVYHVLPRDLPELIAAGDAGDWRRFAAVAAGSKDPEFKEFKPLVNAHHLPGTPGGTVEIRAVTDPNTPIATVFEREVTDEQLKAVWPGYVPPSARPEAAATGGGGSATGGT